MQDSPKTTKKYHRMAIVTLVALVVLLTLSLMSVAHLGGADSDDDLQELLMSEINPTRVQNLPQAEVIESKTMRYEDLVFFTILPEHQDSASGDALRGLLGVRIVFPSY